MLWSIKGKCLHSHIAMYSVASVASLGHAGGGGRGEEDVRSQLKPKLTIYLSFWMTPPPLPRVGSSHPGWTLKWRGSSRWLEWRDRKCVQACQLVCAGDTRPTSRVYLRTAPYSHCLGRPSVHCFCLLLTILRLMQTGLLGMEQWKKSHFVLFFYQQSERKPPRWTVLKEGTGSILQLLLPASVVIVGPV